MQIGKVSLLALTESFLGKNLLTDLKAAKA
jgi:hypothetical protein